MDFLLSPPRNVLASNPGCRFTLPPLDGSLTCSEIYDFHYEHNPDHPFFVHPNPTGGITQLPYAVVVPAMYRAAQFITSSAKIDLSDDTTPLPTVAILATCDPITYMTTVLGMLRAGIPVFVVSHRCSAPVIAALFAKTGTSYVLISQELSIRELAKSAIEKFIAADPDHTSPPEILPMPSIDRIYSNNAPVLPPAPRKRDLLIPRLIMHSSGTTSMPKPIYWNDRFLLQILLNPYFGNLDICENVFACHSLVPFHSMAWIAAGWAISSGLVWATFDPAFMPPILTAEIVFQGIVQTSATWAFTVPTFIEQWATDEKKITHLTRLTGLGYGGGPLNKRVGDALTQDGVNLYTFYGSTESGPIGADFHNPLGRDWQYFSINPSHTVEFIPRGVNAYEVVLLAKPTSPLCVVNTKCRGQDAYSTNDLVAPHPTKAGLWMVLGRSDDQITLSTGEKTNPGPLESILREDPHIAAAVVFGRGKFQIGVILEPTKEFVFDPSDDGGKLVEFRDKIWPTVERWNATAPGHSRLFKEMILVSSPAKPFKYTGKRTIPRGMILVDYESEIEHLYDTLEEMMRTEPPNEWTQETALIFVAKVVHDVLRRTLTDSEDMFDCGCDSLQATWIRNSIMHALLKTPNVSLDTVSSSFVYQHPSVGSLAQYVLAVTRDGSQTPMAATKLSLKADDVMAVVARYTYSFPKHVPSATAPAIDEDVVFITGTTGALGSAVLAQLVTTDSVKKIFAFNRPSRLSKGIYERQREGLKARGYDPGLASSSKVVFVEGELSAAGLGVDFALENEIRQTVTHIIHMAWRVDFNLSLGSFENAIAGVRTLVDFALSSPQPEPPHLHFTSSIGTLRNLGSEIDLPIREAQIENSTVAIGQGYAESKWVSEMILSAAAKASALRPTVIRVGQVCGGVNGSWNTSEWVPALIRSSVSLGCLPQTTGLVSWIPLHLAAQALVEMRNTYAPTVNLVHPQPARWSDIFQVVSHELSLPLVPYAEWEAKLEQAAAKAATKSTDAAKFAQEVPAATILDFFKTLLKCEQLNGDGYVLVRRHQKRKKSRRGNSNKNKNKNKNANKREALGIPRFVMEQGVELSMSLRTARRVSEKDVRSWIKYWKSVGFLS